MSTTARKEKKENKENQKISLKLLVDMKSKKVLFAEAGKDFVDFLFSLLQIPFGTIIAILHKQQESSHANAYWGSGSGSGSFYSIYESVKNLDPTYFQSVHDQESLMKPKWTAVTNTSYMLTDILTKNVVEGSNAEEGFVKGVVTYMVMDNLEVKPMSATSVFSSISLINSLQIKDVSKLVEWNVKVDNKKALELVKAMLDQHRETVLTNVFFPKQASPTPVAIRSLVG